MRPISSAARADTDLPGAAGDLSSAQTPTSAVVKSNAAMDAAKQLRDNMVVDMSGVGKAFQRFGAGAVKMFQKLAGDDPDAKLEKEVVIDWWSKFYASVGHDEAGPKYKGDLIHVIDQPLERVYELADQITAIELFKGTTETGRARTGVFKGNFAVFVLDANGRDPTEYDASGKPVSIAATPAEKKSGAGGALERLGLRRRRSRREQERASSGMDSNKDIIHKIWPSLPDKSPVEALVRLYIVRAMDLTPRDDNGLSDPFVIVQFGKHKPINDKKNCTARNVNPVFGRVLPRD
eukprot:Unigene2_Nuclearia_a/m.9 Unigene2_Nuclearia_a/g.9  ORF Unigene2_Nuclearia_a/g.9 Unigene2_Nuclearia_a/m.9 type:complete len:293 (-) Unigene2_Nuclearia_a:2258-3136(-)